MDPGMTATARWTIGIASVVFAVAGYLIGAHGDAREGAGSVATGELPAARAPRETPQRSDTSMIAAPAPAAPAARYAELVRRAETDDRDAAVALATMLSPCAMRRFFDNETVGYEISLDEDSPLRPRMSEKAIATLSTFAETSRAKVREAEATCEGLTPEQVLTRGHWLYRAGELGDAASALEFARGDFLRDDALAHLDEVAFWRDHAESMLQRALDGGQRDALALLAAAHDPSNEHWIDGPRFAPDPVSAYTYYLAWSLASDFIDVNVEGALDRLGDQLTEADRMRARAEAADICQNDLPLVCDREMPAPR
jgi:hypothetical protein